MRTNKSKNGISLIVLIITIIVMIILAAAIILSISNSGIVDKANKAKTDSDSANLKEYVNVLEAEWEMMTKKEQKATGFSKRADYVNAKLSEKGYEVEITEDGTILSESVVKVLKAGLKVGDTVVGYTLDTTKSSYSTSGKENTAPESTETSPTSQTVYQTPFITWKYAGISENGEIMIVPDMITDSNTMILSGKGGYLNGPEELNTVCNALYSTSKGVARCINIDDVNSILEYTGPKGFYWRTDSSPVFTDEPLNLNQIESSGIQLSLVGTETPDGLDIKSIKSNAYYYSFSDDYVTNEENKINTIKSEISYWLASSCFRAYTMDKSSMFLVFWVSQYSVGRQITNDYCFRSNSGSNSVTFAVRPIIEINSDVSISYSNGILTLN